VEAVLAWLNSNPGWLLILDNVDTHSAADVADRLMGRIEGGRVLLTSRLTEFPLSVDPLDLGMLALPDAAALLLEGSAAGRPVAPDDTAQAEALAEALGRLALALTMAAATMRARQLSFAQYRAIWGNNRSRVIGWAKPEITGYHHAVAETWRTSVDQLSGSGRHLLELLAFLAPDPVPAFLLDLPVPNVAFEDSHAALDNLATYSLATRLGGWRVSWSSRGRAHLGSARSTGPARRCCGCTRRCGGDRGADRTDHGRARHSVSWEGIVCPRGTVLSPRACHRRGKPWRGPSNCRDPPRKPRPVAASHQSTP